MWRSSGFEFSQRAQYIQDFSRAKRFFSSSTAYKKALAWLYLTSYNMWYLLFSTSLVDASFDVSEWKGQKGWKARSEDPSLQELWCISYLHCCLLLFLFGWMMQENKNPTFPTVSHWNAHWFNFWQTKYYRTPRVCFGSNNKLFWSMHRHFCISNYLDKCVTTMCEEPSLFRCPYVWPRWVWLGWWCHRENGKVIQNKKR